MRMEIKITCPPMLDYLLHRPDSRDYRSLPLILARERFQHGFRLLTPAGVLHADDSRVDQRHAAKVFGAFGHEGISLQSGASSQDVAAISA
jgi:hypothetical protein